ncbi:hypothetical protein LTR82_002555 [Friedmanniomyces endolithicus]|uniref:Uncharacterized protein n=1 Tax=Friedmanniomyces endolithicus TaxID=329885 RepID=A0AAN6JE23_9PEZI|nr:hypothetical protein LTR82_002555 [Friedmanniomyces endolithicus]
MADDAGHHSPLLRLPREVQVHILTYLLPQGEHTPMGLKEVKSKKRIKLEREAKLLLDPNWRRPQKVHFAILLVHPDISAAGLMAFWRGNTFAFGECDKLRDFSSFARTEAVCNITAIELGEDYHFTEYCDTFWQPSDNEPYVKKALRRPCGREDWLHPGWPASLEILPKLPNLRRLELHVGTLAECDYTESQGVNGWAQSSLDQQSTPRNQRSTHYLRDQVLLSIPRETLNKLQSLKMIYCVPVSLVNNWNGKFSADVLPYTKDLHSGAWNDPPYRPGTELMGPKETGLYDCWLEARAAVYWDETVEKIWRAAGGRSMYHREHVSFQWCSWAREWPRRGSEEWHGEQSEDWDGETSFPESFERPRSKEELAEEVAALQRTEDTKPRTREELDEEVAAARRAEKKLIESICGEGKA